MFSRSDRYVLRQMVGPFLLALFGFVLFILLNVMLGLSAVMVDRGISMGTLIRLMLYKMPYMIVVAVPMATLFATFLGLGRLSHDREIVALESLGIALRRILLPLVLAASVIAAFDVAAYNWVVPASEAAFQREWTRVLFTRGAPQIAANQFFKGTEDQFFYIRRYDKDTDTLYDVVIYDTTGRLFPQAQTQVTMITAEQGRWTGDAWELELANVYGFDREVRLVFSATLEGLSIPLDQSVEEVLFQSRTPAEMSISELRTRIRQAQAAGQEYANYLFEVHQKIALPLATIVFVLVGGAVSLAFSPRSRSAGIVVGLVFVAVFNGVMWYTQTLGVRNVIDPVIAAWLPNLVFGVAGVFLFLRVDRLASRDVWNRVRARIPFLALILLFLAVPVEAQEIPIELDSDSLFISADRSVIEAEGDVRIAMEGTHLFCDRLRLERTDPGAWTLSANGHVTMETEDDLALRGDALTLQLETSSGNARAVEIAASGFEGESAIRTHAREDHRLYFRGEEGTITFDEDGAVALIEATDAELTTCDCCGVPMREQPYTLQASRVRFYPDRLIVAFGLVARVGGVPSFWLPVYVQPLEETLESPLFPAIGRSQLRGWFLKWNIPFYLNESFFGSVRFDYFNRFSELGAGLVLRMKTPQLNTHIDAYAFPARIGEAVLRISLSQSVILDETWTLGGSVHYEAIGEEREWTFSGRTDGSWGAWDVSLLASRTWEAMLERATERLPELSLSRTPIQLHGAAATPRLAAGWVREWTAGELTASAARVSGRLNIDLDAMEAGPITLTPTLGLRASLYDTVEGFESLWVADCTVPIDWGALRVTYDGTFVTGASPFGFDRSENDQEIVWRIQVEDDFAARLSGGFDLTDRMVHPVRGTFEWQGLASWSCEILYLPRTATLDSITLRGDWQDDVYDIRWTLPYEPGGDGLGTITLAFSATPESGRSLDIDLKLDEEGLSTLRTGIEWESESAWGATLSATYATARPQRLEDVRYGIFRDIGECIRVGAERRGGDVWVYASVLAFPEAVLRYAPETSSIQLGE